MHDWPKSAGNPSSVCYSVFGLTLGSNVSIPGLHTSEIGLCNSDSAVPDVLLYVNDTHDAPWTIDSTGKQLYYETAWLAPSGEPALRVWTVAEGTALHLSYFDGMQFLVDRGGQNVWCRIPDNSSVEDAATYLLGPVLGLILRLRGITCLHASAVLMGSKAVAFVGPPGAGKSTTAAALARGGCPVLTDDIATLSESGSQFHVFPSYPYLALWPEPVSALYGSENVAPRFIPTWEKRRLAAGNQGLRFEREAHPLGAVYILGERRESVEVVEIRKEAALLALIANTYATNILDRRMRAQEFQVLSRLIESVPVRRIEASQDLRGIRELCSLICEDFATLNALTPEQP